MMRHPYEKFIRLELLSIALMVVIGVIALIKGLLLLIFFCFYMLAVSLFCDALLHMQMHQTQHAGKQFIKGIMVFLLTTSLMFYL